MLPLRIAARFLRTSPVQSGLIVAGIAVGIAVQIFVGSLITSLQADLVDTTVGSSSHVTLLPVGDDTSVPGALAASVPKDEPLVSTAIAVRSLSAIYSQDDDSVPLSIKGGEATDLDTIYGLSERLTQGDYALDDADILVGTGFAEDYGIAVGDTLQLLLPEGGLQDYTVRGIFDLGAAAANDRFAFMDPGSAAEALGFADDEYTAIEIQLTDVFASGEVADRLAEETGLEAVDWQAENAELLSGLAAQSASSAMIQVFVLVAVALGIASTLAISAVQKTRQIGILKAMGMSDAASGRIFLWQAALLGVAGSLAGLGLGWLLIWSFGFAPVPFSIRIEPRFAAISVGIGITVALVSSIIPTRKTSRLDPIEVIQGG